MELRVVSTEPGKFYVEVFDYGYFGVGKEWHKLRTWEGHWGGGDWRNCVYTSEEAALKAVNEYVEQECKKEAAKKKRKEYVDSYKPVYIKHECK